MLISSKFGMLDSHAIVGSLVRVSVVRAHLRAAHVVQLLQCRLEPRGCDGGSGATGMMVTVRGCELMFTPLEWLFRGLSGLSKGWEYLSDAQGTRGKQLQPLWTEFWDIDFRLRTQRGGSR